MAVQTGVDRNGVKLQIGGTVRLLNACDGMPLGEEVTVTGFDPSPDYDRSCVGIFVDTQTDSIHPNPVEKL